MQPDLQLVPPTHSRHLSTWHHTHKGYSPFCNWHSHKHRDTILRLVEHNRSYRKHRSDHEHDDTGQWIGKDLQPHPTLAYTWEASRKHLGLFLARKLKHRPHKQPPEVSSLDIWKLMDVRQPLEDPYHPKELALNVSPKTRKQGDDRTVPASTWRLVVCTDPSIYPTIGWQNYIRVFFLKQCSLQVGFRTIGRLQAVSLKHPVVYRCIDGLYVCGCRIHFPKTGSPAVRVRNIVTPKHYACFVLPLLSALPKFDWRYCHDICNVQILTLSPGMTQSLVFLHYRAIVPNISSPDP